VDEEQRLAIQKRAHSELQRIAEVRQYFQVTESSDGRIGRALREVTPVIEEFARNPGATVPSVKSYNYGRLQLFQLWRIAECATKLVSRSPALADRVREIARGSYYPERKPQHRGLQAQSELLTGALLEWAGYEPQWQSEGADWIVQVQGRRTPIEVKRISSRDAIKSAMREANAQVMASGGDGIVWVDATDVMTPNYYSWKVHEALNPSTALLPVLKQRGSTLIENSRTRAKSGTVSCIVVFSSFPIEYIDNPDIIQAMIDSGRLPLPTHKSREDYLTDMDLKGLLPILGTSHAEAIYARNMGRSINHEGFGELVKAITAGVDERKL